MTGYSGGCGLRLGGRGLGLGGRGGDRLGSGWCRRGPGRWAGRRRGGRLGMREERTRSVSVLSLRMREESERRKKRRQGRRREGRGTGGRGSKGATGDICVCACGSGDILRNFLRQFYDAYTTAPDLHRYTCTAPLHTAAPALHRRPCFTPLALLYIAATALHRRHCLPCGSCALLASRG